MTSASAADPGRYLAFSILVTVNWPLMRSGIELHLVAGLDGFEHRGIAGAEHHGHAVVHVELLQRTVLDRDLAGRCIDLGDLAVDEIGLRGGAAAQRERQGERRRRPKACGCSCGFSFRAACHLTTTCRVMPASRWPGMRQPNSNCAALGEAPEDFGASLRLERLAVRVVMLHVGILLHQRGVLEIVGGARQHEFVRAARPRS